MTTTAPTTTTRQEDLELIRQCLDGDSLAWEKLVRRYQKLIYSVARVYFKNTMADDVFQDVCVELYRGLTTIRDVQSLPAWLITVTRRTSSKALANISDWEEVEADSLAEADQKISGIEDRFWIEQGLSTLSDRDRQLIEALYLDPNQPSYTEISERLSIPVSSIGPTRARTLKKLREQWEDRHD